jgi:hypothetical protein
MEKDSPAAQGGRGMETLPGNFHSPLMIDEESAQPRQPRKPCTDSGAG